MASVVPGLPPASPDPSSDAADIAALREELARARRLLADRERQMDLIEQLAGLGSWEIDLATDAVRWSREQRRIHDVDEAATPATHAAFMRMVHPDDRRIVDEGMTALATGAPVSVEFRIRRPDGAERRLLARAQRVAADDGRPTRVLGTSLDVTERRDAERILRDREEHVARLERLAGMGSWEMDMTTGQITWSQEQLRIHGLPPDRPHLTEAEFLALVHPEDRATIVDVMRRLVAAGEPFQVEYRIVRPDGAVRVLESPGQLVAGPDGRPTRMIGASRDVTELRATESALRASEESHRTIFQHSSDAIWLHDVHTGEFLEVNQAACEMYGYTAEEQKAIGVVGLSAGVPPYTIETARAYMERAAAGEPQRFEWLGRHKDGREVWGEVRLRRVRINGEDRILATSRDINDRKLAEAALQRANEELERRVAERTAELAASNAALAQEVAEHARAREALLGRTRELEGIFHALPDLYFRLADDGTILDYRTSSHHVLYVPPEQFMGRRLRDVMPAEICDRFDAALAAAAPGAVTSVDYQLPLGDALHDYEARFFPLEDGTRISVVRDVTEAKDAERALREREAHFRRLIENSSDMVLICDATGAITYVGPSVERLLGYTPEEMMGLRPSDNMHPDDVERVGAAIAHLLAHPGEVTTTRYRTLHKDGSWRVHETVGRTVLPDSAEAGVVANCRDITERVQAEEALREHETLFRRLIENSSDQVMIVDTTGAITYVGPSVERLLGYTPEEMLGTRPHDIVHPDDVATVMATIARLVERPTESVTVQYRVRHKDGRWRVFENVANTLVPGTVESGLVANCRDITERVDAERALREHDEYFRRMIENTSDFVMIVDQTAAITYVGPSATRMLGWTPDEMMGTRPTDLVHPDDVPSVMRDFAWIVAHPGEPYNSTFRIRHKDGSYRVFENLGRTLSPTSVAEGIVAFGRDVTERKQAEAALARAKEEAERANRAKSEFLSRMSHELRTPMNSILGFGQLLARGDLPATQAKSVGHILKAGRHLLHLINEVLEIARIEAGRENFSLEPVALAPVLQEALGLMRPVAQQHAVELRESGWPQHAFVHADRQRLVQVLLNLMSNAIKYNRPRGFVRLSCAQAADGRWALRVEDGGRGIPADRVDQLFTPFARLGAEQTDVEGTGLGLALSQRLCEAMGGSLVLESTGPEGSVFRVEIDAAEDPLRGLEETGAHPVPTAPHRDATLLYGEDNLANLSLVETILLSRPGWRTLPALQGQLGVELAREHLPDVILLDLHLPDIPGYEVLRRLRADPRTASIPIVVVSADATPASVERLRAAGADAYLTKPLDVDEFLRAVERFLPGGAA